LASLEALIVTICGPCDDRHLQMSRLQGGEMITCSYGSSTQGETRQGEIKSASFLRRRQATKN